MSANVRNRPPGSFMVNMGISSNIMKSPSPKCYMTFWDMTGAAVVEWLSSWLAEQAVRGSIPGLPT